MNKIFSASLFICTLLFNAIFSADTIYIVGSDSSLKAGYWSIFPPGSPSSFQELNSGTFNSNGRGIAFSQNKTAYIIGDADRDDDTFAASYWTISPSRISSNINILLRTDDDNDFSPLALGIAFKSSGEGYIVGNDESNNPVYWTISPSGTVSESTQLADGGYAAAIAFTPSGTAYVGGLDSSNNAAYWTISSSGIISGPFGLAGGGAGGVGSIYAVVVSPSGMVYLVGSSTSGHACYWTIPNSGIPSSAILLDGGSNSMACGIAFRPDAEGNEGIIVGQTTNNVSCYWPILSNGDSGPLQDLPNGSGGGSCAYGVAYDSSNIAYIVGRNNTNQAAYWTLQLFNIEAQYHPLEGGTWSVAFGIAITAIANPNPPTNLSGRYITNNFGWVYEHCAVLNWTLSDSSGVVAYNIYRNSVKIASVDGSTTKYYDHKQNKSLHSTYAITAVDESGNESSPANIIIN